MTSHKPFIVGQLDSLKTRAVVQSFNPATGEKLPDLYPVSDFADLETAVFSAQEAATILLATPPETIAQFLETFADNIEANGDEICRVAAEETASALCHPVARD